MNQESSQFRPKQEHNAMGQQQSGGRLEFANAEELLRHDAGHLTPPDAIVERLKQSLASEPQPKSWWQRLFSK